MSLPVSVIVPHRKSRAWFFERFCLPSIKINDPAEIIVEDWEGGACEKRNAGASKAIEPNLLFVDDDSILYEGALGKMLASLEADPNVSFAYSDTSMVLYDGIPYPNEAGVRKACEWDVEKLKRGNYVETTSLLRKKDFPGFDPAIRRFQDWDLWLTLAARGKRGTYIPEVLFELHHFDIGVSASVPFGESLEAIKRKHRIS